MSSLAALSSPNQNTKPGSIIYSETIACKNMTVSGTQAIQNLEVKNNLLVDGYSNTLSDQETVGTLTMNSLFPVASALPVGTGGGVFTFSPTLNKIVNSGLTAANSATASTNGSNFAQLTTPFSNPMITWMPNVGLFSGVDIVGTAVYTSPTAVNGTWVIGTPVPSAFDIDGGSYYSSAYQRVYAGNVQVGSRIYSTSNGSVWTPCSASRPAKSFSYAPSSSGLGTGNGRLVTIGVNGPAYSDDGVNFLPSNVNTSMGSVTWSDYWNKFVALSYPGGVFTNIHTSVDGINWVVVPNAFSAGVVEQRTIIWIPQLQIFVSGGFASQFWISKDGLSWRRLFGTVVSLDVYGSTYIKEWGQYLSGGLGAVLGITARHYFG